MERNPTPLPAPERTHSPGLVLHEPEVDPMLGEHFADYPLPFMGTGRTYPRIPRHSVPLVLLLVVEDIGGAFVESMELAQLSATELRLTRRVRKHATDAFVRQEGIDYVLSDGVSREWLGESAAEAGFFLSGPASRF